MYKQTKKKKLMIKILHDELMNNNYENNPIWNRLVELGKQHLSLSDAIKIVEQEFGPLSTN